MANTRTSRKIAIVGVGGVGMGCAYSILNQGLVDEMVLIDVAGDKADGEARDLMDGVTYAPENCKVYHGDYSDCKDAQMVIITAGINQKPGQSRLELVGTNAKIMRSIVKEVMGSGFDGNLVIVSNPVDVLTYVAWDESGLPQNRVSVQVHHLTQLVYGCNYQTRQVLTHMTSQHTSLVNTVTQNNHYGHKLQSVASH